MAFSPDTLIFNLLRQKLRLAALQSWKSAALAFASRKSVAVPKARMNLKSSAKKPGLNLRKAGDYFGVPIQQQLKGSLFIIVGRAAQAFTEKLLEGRIFHAQY